MTQYMVQKALMAITEVRRLLQLVTRFAHISGGILVHSSLQILSKSLRFLDCLLETQSFSAIHIFSMGLRFGDWLGFFLSHSFVALAVCFGSLSCWKTHPRPIFSVLAEGRRFLSNILRYTARPLVPQCGEVVLYP